MTGAPVLAGHAAARSRRGDGRVRRSRARDAAARAGGQRARRRARCRRPPDGALAADAADVVLADVERFRARRDRSRARARRRHAGRGAAARRRVPAADRRRRRRAERARGRPRAAAAAARGRACRPRSSRRTPASTRASRARPSATTGSPRRATSRPALDAIVSAQGSGHGDRGARRPRGREPRPTAPRSRPRERATCSPASSPGCSPAGASRSRPPRPARTCTGARPPQAGTGDELVATDLIAALPSTLAALRIRTRLRGTRMADVDAFRPVWAEVDLDAVRANVRRCARWSRRPRCARSSRPTATATARSPVEPRRGRSRRRRVSRSRSSKKACSCARPGSTRRSSCLSEPVPAAAETVVAYGLTPVVYTADRHRRARQGRGSRTAHARTASPVHLKVDTGMHRVGCDPERRRRARRARRRSRRAAARRRVHALRGRRRARERLHRRAAAQRSTACSPRCARRGLPTGVVHACNTAGAIAVPGARYDMVRVGIGIYGVAPSPALARRGRPAAGDVGEGARLARAGRSRPARASRTACATRRRRRRASRRCRSATPTACRASCRTAAARC